MSEDILVNDTRSGVMLVHNSERLVAVWSQSYLIDRSLQPDEREDRRRDRIHRGERGAPILLTKRGRRSSFLTGRTIRKFEAETGLRVKAIKYPSLDRQAAG